MTNTPSAALSGQSGTDGANPDVSHVQRKFTRAEALGYWTAPDDGANRPEQYIDDAQERLAERSTALVDLVASHVERGARIIELGCNAGRNLQYLRRAGYERLEGLEISPDAVAMMRSTLPDLAASLTLHLGALEDLMPGFPDRSFDAVVTMAVLIHLHPDSEDVLEHIARVADRWIITVEEESQIDSPRHFARLYRPIFEGLGFRQVALVQPFPGMNRGYAGRVFRRRDDLTDELPYRFDRSSFFAFQREHLEALADGRRTDRDRITSNLSGLRDSHRLLRAELSRSKRALETRSAEAARSSAVAAQLQHELSRSSAALEAARAEAKVLASACEKRDADLAAAQRAKQAVERDRDLWMKKARIAALERNRLMTSWSWRLTAPLRAIRRLFSRSRVRANPAGAAAVNSSRPPPGSDRSISARTSDRALVGEGRVAWKTAEKKPKSPHKDKEPSVRELDALLWHGFSHTALSELEALLADAAAPPNSRASAALSLAAWQIAEGKTDIAQRLAARARALSDDLSSPTTLKAALLDAFCLVRLACPDAARDVLRPFERLYPDDPQVTLAMSATYAAEAHGSSESEASKAALDWINRILVGSDLAALRPIDPSKPLGLDNLFAPDARPVDDPHKVSVIVPAYRCAHTISFALDGLSRQTWRNLEIIVVDDASGDSTPEVVREWSARDARIRLLNLEINLGAYAARNRGLAEATGEFITTHDSDDWSHPQKIERQMRHLLGHPEIIGNYSRWARFENGLIVSGKFRHRYTILDWNPSSFLFRRGLVDRIGFWDEVRVSADAEFIARAKVAIPEMQIETAPENAPLSFALDTPASLTKAGISTGRTRYHGIRRTYHEAAQRWRETAGPDALRLQPGSEQRPFPAPGPILPKRSTDATADLLLIDDFARPLAASDPAMAELRAAAARGKSLAIFHWPRIGSDPTRRLADDILDLAQRGALRVIAPGETVRVAEVVVTRPRVLLRRIDHFPIVATGHVRVLDDPKAWAADASQRREAEATLLECLGVPGIWDAPADTTERADG